VYHKARDIKKLTSTYCIRQLRYFSFMQREL
jgi:hypothetical protein